MSDEQPKSLEHRLFEAYHKKQGVTLGALDVFDLCEDEAVGTRIANQALIESGAADQLSDSTWGAKQLHTRKTWEALKRWMIQELKPKRTRKRSRTIVWVPPGPDAPKRRRPKRPRRL